MQIPSFLQENIAYIGVSYIEPPSAKNTFHFTFLSSSLKKEKNKQKKEKKKKRKKEKKITYTKEPLAGQLSLYNPRTHTCVSHFSSPPSSL